MATLPVGEIVDENDPVHSVEENMSCVPLAVAPSDVPKLYEERFLLLRSLHELVQLHLEAGQDFSTNIMISVCTSIEHPTVQDGFGSAVS